MTLLAVALPPAWATAQDVRVSLELVTVPNYPLDQARKWISTLEKAGITGVRIRGGAAGDRPQVEQSGTAQLPVYKVTGILTLEEKLILPSGKFSASDVAGLKGWLARLKEGGSEGLSAKPGAFGLSPAQLVATHEALAGKTAFGTKGQSARDAVGKIADSLSVKLTIDASAEKALAASDPISDELRGLSHGTVLAAIVRPAGLVLAPVKDGAKVELRIMDSKSAKEAWPIGWPLPDKKVPKDVVPELLKFIPVEINDTPLGEALTAVGGRLKVPLVIDYNGLARQRVDLATTKVTLPKMKTFYAKILDRLLFQARLKYEVRLDEADQPFLWITELSVN